MSSNGLPVQSSALEKDDYENSTRPASNETDVASHLSKTGKLLSWTVLEWLSSILLGFMWLGPGIFLLWANFSSWVIGASAWCPNDICPVISYRTIYGVNSRSALALKADGRDRDLLGSLQIIAKIIEIWFLGVAASLVYIVTLLLIRSYGVPTYHLLAHIQIFDMLSLLKPNFYLSAKPLGRSGNKLKLESFIIYGFIAFLFLICGISNLVGPAAAVLVLPRLEWIDTPNITAGTFRTMLSETPPSNGFMDEIRGCDNSALAAGSYSCSYLIYANDMDALAEANIEAELSSSYPELPATNPYLTSDEMNIPIVFNYSRNHLETDVGDVYDISWAPNRQVIRAMERDFREFSSVILNGSHIEPYTEFNNSLRLEMQREGPVAGMRALTGFTNPTFQNLGDDRIVHCYPNSVESDIGAASKCFAIGTGWNASNRVSNFTLTDPINGTVAVADLFWTDRVAYILDDELRDCNMIPLTNTTNIGTVGTSTRCDWNRLLSQGLGRDLPGIENYSRISLSPSFFMELRMPESRNQTWFAMQVIPFISKALYDFDITTVGPTMEPVRLSRLDEKRTDPITVHPDWLLLALSLDNGQGLSTDRPIGRNIYDSLSVLLNDSNGVTDQDQNPPVTLYATTLAMFYQMLSLITYELDPPYNQTGFSSDDHIHPIFNHNVRRYVWKYGLESRSPRFGVSIVIMACGIVFIRTVLLLAIGPGSPSLIELIKAAMQHKNEGEFNDAEGDKQTARVRYKLHRGEGRRLVFKSTN